MKHELRCTNLYQGTDLLLNSRKSASNEARYTATQVVESSLLHK